MLSVLALIFGVVGLIVVATLWRAWVLTVLWVWFLVPLGAPAITIATAIGISLVAGMFTTHLQTKSDSEKDVSALVGKALGHAIGGPAIVLFIGWVVTLFM
jgi:dolichyl-phosphate-mannose--protein O-mannosyl transferase